MYWRRIRTGSREGIQGNIMYPQQYQLEGHDRIAQTGAINNRETEKMSCTFEKNK